MAKNSGIEWTEDSWNPTSGCKAVSPGCENCYAMRFAHRMANAKHRAVREAYRGTTRLSGGRPKWTGKIGLIEHRLAQPYTWKTSHLVFVDSMSDLFHEDIPLDYIRRVFEVMEATPKHTYQILTKRSERLQKLSSSLPWPRNVWMGVSVENQDYWFRVDDLRHVPVHVRFLSLKPLLGPLLTNDLKDIHWVIVGGESAPKARPINPEWVRSIREDCLRQRVPFFFKQWGGINKKATGRVLDGRIWDQMPPRRTGLLF
jgi:protein gp37